MSRSRDRVEKFFRELLFSPDTPLKIKQWVADELKIIGVKEKMVTDQIKIASDKTKSDAERRAALKLLIEHYRGEI